MSILSKEEWERRERNVCRRNAENKGVLEEQSIDEEVANAMATLCAFRHNLHTNGRDILWCSEHCEHRELEKDLNCGIHEMLEEQGIENDLFWDTDDLWSDSLTDVMDDYDISEEEAQEEISIFVERVNTEIEEFLRCFDEKHGTNYAPTGEQRY